MHLNHQLHDDVKQLRPRSREGLRSAIVGNNELTEAVVVTCVPARCQVAVSQRAPQASLVEHHVVSLIMIQCKDLIKMRG